MVHIQEKSQILTDHFFSMIFKFSHSGKHNGKELIIFPSLFYWELKFLKHENGPFCKQDFTPVSDKL